ncbi:MAG: holo-ACP synthase [Chloroflexi bacterium]|nr:holo-ACP synthase [Chloroflexota bacterium]MBP8055397.1 holo-ACP synthase [Chloroflexota bacterium]
MLASGVDMIEVDRIAQGITRHGQRFLDRFFTAQEQKYCAGQAARLAGRFAVKEAVSKALGTGIGDMNWTDIEVVCNNRGKPELVLHNKAQEIAAAQNLHHWSISLSHTQSHAIAFAVALGKVASQL